MRFKVRFREGIDFDAKFNGVRTVLVDQQFSPESKNAQSGKAVAEAISKADIFANALKGSANGSAVAFKDVSPLEHDIDVKVASKNIIPFPYPEDTTTGSGVTFTAQADGGVSATGTATGQKNFTLYYGDLLADGNITFSLSGEFTNLTAVLILRDEEKNTLLNRNVETSFTANLADYPSATKMEIIIKRIVNAEVSGTVYPQLELGTTATAYTPFADVSSVTLKKYGKNLLANTIPSTDFANGTKVVKNQDGSLTVTKKAGDLISLYSDQVYLPSGKYTFSNGLGRDTVQSGLNPVYIILYKDNGNTPCTLYSYDKATASLESGYYRFRLYGPVAVEFDTFTIRPMTELGGTATEYEPYKEPIPYTPKADGVVDGVTSLYPTTTLLTDTEGVIISAEYNKDLNKAFDSLVKAIISLGGNV